MYTDLYAIAKVISDKKFESSFGILCEVLNLVDALKKNIKIEITTDAEDAICVNVSLNGEIFHTEIKKVKEHS